MPFSAQALPSSTSQFLTMVSVFWYWNLYFLFYSNFFYVYGYLSSSSNFLTSFNSTSLVLLLTSAPW